MLGKVFEVAVNCAIQFFKSPTAKELAKGAGEVSKKVAKELAKEAPKTIAKVAKAASRVG